MNMHTTLPFESEFTLRVYNHVNFFYMYDLHQYARIKWQHYIVITYYMLLLFLLKIVLHKSMESHKILRKNSECCKFYKINRMKCSIWFFCKDHLQNFFKLTNFWCIILCKLYFCQNCHRIYMCADLDFIICIET